MKSSERYQRQMILAEIGAEGQRTLSETRVLCVGAGGLGSPALLYLASAGIGHLGIVDGDKVSKTNLHRQIIFNDDDIGEFKAKTAALKLKKQNPEINVEAHGFFIDADNARSIIEKYDIVIDGTDNFETKYLLNDVCIKLNKPLVHASISQFEGRVAVFHSAEGACYRCMYPLPPKAEIQNCAEAGIIGAVAGVIGSMQALETIKTALWLKNKDTKLKPIFSKVAVFDFNSFNTTVISIGKKLDCLCSTGKPANLHQTKKPEYHECIFIDVREKHEWDNGHIEGAIHWPLIRFAAGDFPKEIQNTPEKVVLYCEVGGRSARALSLLAIKGITGVRHFSGGYQAWCSQRA